MRRPACVIMLVSDALAKWTPGHRQPPCCFSFDYSATRIILDKIHIHVLRSSPSQWRQIGVKAFHFTHLSTGCSSLCYQIDVKGNIKAPNDRPFVMGIHRWPLDALQKGTVIRKAFPCNDVTMTWKWDAFHCGLSCCVHSSDTRDHSGYGLGQWEKALYSNASWLISRMIPGYWYEWINVAWQCLHMVGKSSLV